MNTKSKFSLAGLVILSISILTMSYSEASEGLVPDWIKNTALWYGEDQISESEFLNAIKFLIENQVIVIESETKAPRSTTENIIIPNGNAATANTGFYLPLHLEITKGTTVVWINDDEVPHTVQSQDAEGNIIGLFNSAPLYTGDRFPYTFQEEGVYNYFCTLHPWRVGVITVT